MVSFNNPTHSSLSSPSDAMSSSSGSEHGTESGISFSTSATSVTRPTWLERIQLARGDYSVGWICALPLEVAAAEAMLDETHAPLETPKNDSNAYVLGRIGFHNVVIACPGWLSSLRPSATEVACQMQASFPAVKFSLLVGVGGGVPFNGPDVRVGDVVVGYPTGDGGGLVQYARTEIASGTRLVFGSTDRPPIVLLAAIAKLRAQHLRSGNQVAKLFNHRFARQDTASIFLHPGGKHDMLFANHFEHDQRFDTCEYCVGGPEVRRPNRPSDEPVVHYGVIASGNYAIQNASTRDYVSKGRAIICFDDMAAGLASDFPCLVIRGISHYSDSHRTTLWQPYAAAAAACFARQLLDSMQPHEGPRHLSSKRYQPVLSSLAFEGAQPRLEDTALPDNGACQWFFRHPAYVRWTSRSRIRHHLCFLWIEGVPGSGKSTLMKSICKHVGAAMSDAAVVSIVFDARGSGVVTSTPDLYRALLLQILQAVPSTLNVLDGFDPQSARDILWNRPLLQGLLGRAIGRLQNRRLFCFVDTGAGLGNNDFRELVSFFQDLGHLGLVSNVKLHVCFSSRSFPYFPYVTADSGHRLRLEAQEGHDQAIEDFIRANLTISKGMLADGVRERVRLKAAGVFAWVVLAVDILSKEYAKGGIFALREKLEQLPDSLEDLQHTLARHDIQVQDGPEVGPAADAELFISPHVLENDRTAPAPRLHDTSSELRPVDTPSRRPRMSLGSPARPGHAREPIMIPSSLLEGHFPLHVALALDDEKQALRLLQKSDTDIRSPDELGRTPLTWAATKGFYDVADLILDKLDDEDVAAVDMYGHSPLSRAAQSGHVRLVERLLAIPTVDADARDSSGRSPLSWAAAGGFTDIASLLLETGRVDPDGTDEYGRTPLSWAAQGGHMDVVETLLATGLVHANQQDTTGWTASAWAHMAGHDKVAARLQRVFNVCRSRRRRMTYC